MIYQDDIVLVDRDGDILSVSGDPLKHADGTTKATPCLAITQGAHFDEMASTNILNTGRTVSVFVDQDDMRDRVLPDLVRRFFGPDARIEIGR